LQKIGIFILLFVIVPTLYGNDHSKFHIGLGYGLWKPTALDDNPSKPFKNVTGAEPYISASMGFSTFDDHIIRFDYFEWSQQGLDELLLHSITLRVLSADFQYILIPDTPISPFVTYGVSAVWSSESPFTEPETPTPPDRAGIGFDVGAGFLMYLSGQFALSAEYKFLYAIFSKDVGYTNNYSGPNLSIKFLYYF